MTSSLRHFSKNRPSGWLQVAFWDLRSCDCPLSDPANMCLRCNLIALVQVHLDGPGSGDSPCWPRNITDLQSGACPLRDPANPRLLLNVTKGSSSAL